MSRVLWTAGRITGLLIWNLVMSVVALVVAVVVLASPWILFGLLTYGANGGN